MLRIMARLERSFFLQDTLTVARALLGQRLVRVLENGQRLAGIIVETEAYIGEEDKACHAAHGRTARNAVMYGPPGHAYVYFIYGMHYCLNVVTEPAGFPAAVLIRALEPCEGIEWMRLHRHGRPDSELTNGPGRLCQALAIGRAFNGYDLCTGPLLFTEPGHTNVPVACSQRVGISADELAKERPWRFFVPDNPFVSTLKC